MKKVILTQDDIRAINKAIAQDNEDEDKVYLQYWRARTDKNLNVALHVLAEKYGLIPDTITLYMKGFIVGKTHDPESLFA